MDMSIRFPWPGLYFENVPKGIRILGTEITLYGLLIALGMLFALCSIALEARRNRGRTNHYLAAYLVCSLMGIAGARLYYAWFYWNIYSVDPFRLLKLREGGLAFFGGLLGGLLGLALVCLITRENFGRMADSLCLCLLTGQMIGRWGDFFNRSSFGEYTQWPTAMQLPLSAVHSSEVTTRIRENLINVEGSTYIQVHPAFLYESLWCLLLLLLLLVGRRKSLFNGEIFLRYLCGYCFGHFFIEWIRTDKLLIPGTVLDANMIVSAALFALSLVILLIRRSMAKKRIEYRRQRQEQKYAFEEQIAAEEEKRQWQREERAERINEGEYVRTVIPDDVRQAMEELENESRQRSQSDNETQQRTDETDMTGDSAGREPEILEGKMESLEDAAFQTPDEGEISGVSSLMDEPAWSAQTPDQENDVAPLPEVVEHESEQVPGQEDEELLNGEEKEPSESFSIMDLLMSENQAPADENKQTDE